MALREVFTTKVDCPGFASDAGHVRQAAGTYPAACLFGNELTLAKGPGGYRFGGMASRTTTPSVSLRISRANRSTESSSLVLSDV